jgi:hypothetical protein
VGPAREVDGGRAEAGHQVGADPGRDGIDVGHREQGQRAQQQDLLHDGGDQEVTVTPPGDGDGPGGADEGVGHRERSGDGQMPSPGAEPDEGQCQDGDRGQERRCGGRAHQQSHLGPRHVAHRCPDIDREQAAVGAEDDGEADEVGELKQECQLTTARGLQRTGGEDVRQQRDQGHARLGEQQQRGPVRGPAADQADPVSPRLRAATVRCRGRA